WEYCPDTGETVLDGVEQALFEVAGPGATHITPLLARIVDEDRGAVEDALRRAVQEDGDYEATFRVRRDDGSTRWVKGFGRVIAGSVPARLVGVSIDVTPEYTLAETRDLMLREMNHRVKNLFAVIAGMIVLAARNHDDVQVFSADVRERIASLGRAHSLASPAGQPEAIGLREIVEATLAPYAEHAAISIDGPNVALDRSCLSPLALIFHEWATNSVKYGALGSAGARRLSVEWRVEDDALMLVWNEEDGSVGDERTDKRGFGTLLVDTSVRQLRGSMTRTTGDGAYRLEMRLPMGVLSHA
ncbi:MAG: chemotaxis protein, partial [Sphingomonadales bacterium]|nr:chemotaxis protein [Sphingomonadales bacterium]